MSVLTKKIPKQRLTLAEFEGKERGMLWAIADFASDQLVSVYSETLGVKAPEAAYRSALIARDSARLLSEQYLLNSKRSTLEMGTAWGVFSYNAGFQIKGCLAHRDLQEADVIDNAATVALPKPLPLKDSLGSVIRSRRSIREMSGRPLSLAEVSTLLYYGDGCSGEFDFVARSVPGSLPPTQTFGEAYVGEVRCAPSGGGLYPVDIVFLALKVRDLPAGIYRYLPITHRLEVVRELEDAEVEEYYRISGIGKNIDQAKVALSIGYVYALYTNSRKYGDLGLSFALIEAGRSRRTSSSPRPR